MATKATSTKKRVTVKDKLSQPAFKADQIVFAIDYRNGKILELKVEVSNTTNIPVRHEVSNKVLFTAQKHSYICRGTRGSDSYHEEDLYPSFTSVSLEFSKQYLERF